MRSRSTVGGGTTSRRKVKAGGGASLRGKHGAGSDIDGAGMPWVGLEGLEPRLLLSGVTPGGQDDPAPGSPTLVIAAVPDLPAGVASAIYSIELDALAPEGGDIGNPYSVNFTTQGLTDWAQYGPLSFTGGLEPPPPYNHKAGVANPISNVSDITGSGELRGYNVTTPPNALVRLQVNYSDGTPNSFASENEGFVFDKIPDLKGQGLKFTVTIPANVSGVLRVYANTYNGKAMDASGNARHVPVNLRAVFDDATSLDRSDILPISPYDPGGAPGTEKEGSAHGLGVYTIAFANGETAQTLTVYYTQDVTGFGSDRNVGLYGVTLDIPNLPTAPAKQIIDDRDAGFTTTGAWGFTVEPGRYFQDDHSFANGGQGANTATYTFTDLAPGQYRVSATWRADANRATNSPFSIYDGSMLLGTIRLNQELAPGSLTDEGFSFGDIGTTWTITGTSLIVRVSDDANDYVDLDAIRIERVGELPPPAPDVAVTVNGQQLISGSSTVDFGATPSGTPVTRSLIISNTGQLDLHLGAIDPMPSGYILTSTFGTTTLAPGASTTLVITMAAATPGPYIGTWRFFSDDPDEGTFTLSLSGNATATPSPLLPGFTQTRLATGLGSATAQGGGAAGLPPPPPPGRAPPPPRGGAPRRTDLRHRPGRLCSRHRKRPASVHAVPPAQRHLGGRARTAGHRL